MRREIVAGQDTGLMENCIKETLRLSSPTHSLQSRQATKESGWSEGCRVSVMLHGLHRSERHWPQADAFNPDRFNDPAHNHLNSWLPFGMGSRSCIGRSFALKEIETVMRILLTHFNFILPVESPHQDYLHGRKGTFVSPINLQLIFEPRAPKPMAAKNKDNRVLMFVIGGLCVALLLRHLLAF